MRTYVTFNFYRLRRFRDAINRQLNSRASGPVRDALNQWRHRYLAFLHRRFNQFSRGGGDWPPLKASTIAAKKRKGSRNPSLILRDLDYLYDSLSPLNRNTGIARSQNIEYGIRIAFAGNKKYPNSSVTIADVMSFHQRGGGRLPQRKIMVPPSDQVILGMRNDMQRAVNKVR